MEQSGLKTQFLDRKATAIFFSNKYLLYIKQFSKTRLINVNNFKQFNVKNM